MEFFFYISPLKFLDLVLIPGVKLDGHRGTWTGCQKDYLPHIQRKSLYFHFLSDASISVSMTKFL